MPLINRILFPVDFSDASTGAARYVEALAGRFQASILLLHIVGMGEHSLPEELLPLRQAQLNAFLADELKYFTTERLCVIGDEPAPIIGAEACRWQADLVMMPTRGLGDFEKLFLGSVTEKVLADLALPVWTSVHSEEAPPLEQIHCRKILCAVDLGDRTQSVLKFAAAMAAEYSSALGIVHAAADLPTGVISVGLEQELQHSVSDQARLEIESLRAKEGITAKIFTGIGDPAKVIATAIDEFHADLLVIGRHQDTGVPGLHENAWSILRGSPCPVISI